MYCPECGTQIPDQSNFCPQCGAAVRKRTAPLDFQFSMLSIAGFACSLLALRLGGIVGVAAVILSAMGFQQCKKQGLKGKELSVAGIVIGAVAIVYRLVVLLSVSSLIRSLVTAVTAVPIS